MVVLAYWNSYSIIMKSLVLSSEILAMLQKSLDSALCYYSTESIGEIQRDFGNKIATKYRWNSRDFRKKIEVKNLYNIKICWGFHSLVHNIEKNAVEYVLFWKYKIL